MTDYSTQMSIGMMNQENDKLKRENTKLRDDVNRLRFMAVNMLRNDIQTLNQAIEQTHSSVQGLLKYPQWAWKEEELSEKVGVLEKENESLKEEIQKFKDKETAAMRAKVD